jgi:sigma-B regulation protein RsbU (phosphoserine phosphatase)
MGHGPTVLIIDDDILTITLIKVILKSEGMESLEATEGETGLRLAQAAEPDLILLDIMLPLTDGFEICSKLKQNSLTSAIPVIFLSAISDPKSKTKGLSMGGMDFITKPFDNDELVARIRLHLKSRQAIDLIIEQQKNMVQFREAQQAILVQPDDCPESSFAVCYRPLRVAGGDFYDVVKISNGIFGYMAADMSGHDIGASFATSALKAIIRQNTAVHFTPMETMMMLDKTIRVVLQPGQYLTACYAHLNRNLSKLTVIGAGHPPLIFMARQAAPHAAAFNSDPLGTYEESVTFESWQTPISPGDRFFLYTDGLIDFHQGLPIPRTEGLQFLLEACERFRALPLTESVPEIVYSLLDAEPLGDDVLLLAVEV